MVLADEVEDPDPSICSDFKEGDGSNELDCGEDGVMQFPKTLIIVFLAFLCFSGTLWAQDKTDREVEIRKNIKLIVLSPGADIPEEVTKQYQAFLPVLESSLKESTTDQSDECLLTLRVAAGIKEIGAAKTKRPMAKVTAYRRNSKQEYLGTFLLYSYVMAGPVNKEETMQFLKKQILEPAECRKTAE
jgi:hypothetical protein